MCIIEDIVEEVDALHPQREVLDGEQADRRQPQRRGPVGGAGGEDAAAASARRRHYWPPAAGAVQQGDEPDALEALQVGAAA